MDIVLLFCSFGLLLTLLFRNAQAVLDGESIIGGDEAYPGDYPYQISLEINGKSVCGGSLIDSTHVITAAHCVTATFGGIRSRPYKVVAGISELGTNPPSRVTVDVNKIYVPKLYDYRNFTSETMPADIAVLRLKQAVNVENNPHVSTVKLPVTNKDYTGEKVVISGFGWQTINMKKNPWTGVLEEDVGTRNGKLKWAESVVIGKEECQKGYKAAIHDWHICAVIVQRTDTPEGVCHGDSGGPLVYNGNTLIGIVSTSPIGCREDEAAAVYTRVSSHLDFIRKAVEDVNNPDAKTLVV